MSQSSYLKLFMGPQVEVLKICGALSDVNIIPVVKDRAESARLAGFGSFSTDQEVWVHPDEKEKAEEILKALTL
ncbi:DUF2007 domain-containing protein [Flavobacteriaceae bacterium]|nr:DUF2007 domain-containing protein [Flavobacteriaceae bacterium]